MSVCDVKARATTTSMRCLNVTSRRRRAVQCVRARTTELDRL